MKSPVFLAALIILSISTACDSDKKEVVVDEMTASITGTISYRERMALSDSAVIEISLQDVSRADAAAETIAKQRITGPGQVPVHFTLPFDPLDIDERMSYSLLVRITDRGRLMFINDTSTPVLTRGAGNTVDMILVRVPSKQELPGMALQGMFRYMADAALFRDCRTNKTYPVSMEAKYIELERAYLNSGIEPGSEVMITLRGRLLERPSTEGNINKVKLIVDILEKLEPDNSCSPDTHASLQETYWRLDKVGGEKVSTPDGMKEAHMILSGSESRIRGNAGCNNFFGQFVTENDTLSFSALGATMMACPPPAMETEQKFMAALQSTVRFGISGLFLSLYDADGVLLASLEAVYL
jgi:uncharacterized lipoprotein YbaY/heat shock protein HslJ